jgi:hypothetical protein
MELRLSFDADKSIIPNYTDFKLKDSSLNLDFKNALIYFALITKLDIFNRSLN